MTTVGRNNHSCPILDFRHAVIKVFLLFLHTLPYAASQMENELAPPDQLGPQIGPKFNPLMAIIMVILVSAFFVMGFFSVYIRQCAERRSRPGWDPATAIGAVAPRSWRIGRGLEASVIETFPTFLYSTVKGHKIGKNALECAVCLNEFEDDETLRMIPKCNHVFHPDCIDAWLSSHTTCPVCRANLDSKPGEEVPSATVQIPDPGEPDQGPENNGETHNHGVICGGGGQTRESGSPDLNITTSSPGTSQITPRKITGWRLTGLFPRSHSTGHSLVQPGENCERFTLRLPEDVRSRLMNSTLPRTKSCVAFQRARSSRRSYRSGSLGSGPGRSFYYYERFEQEGRPDRWGFSMTPPFFSKSGSVRSQRVPGDGSSNQVCASPPKALFKSTKQPSDHRFHRMNDNVGERSSDWLRTNNDNQV